MLRRLTQDTRGRLLILLWAVAGVIVITASLNHFVLDRYDDFGDALWLATLYLFDASNLANDENLVERAIGIFQVVTGIVLLVGVLFTLVADSVGDSIARLGMRQAPTRESGHLLVVGGPDQLRQAGRALSPRSRRPTASRRSSRWSRTRRSRGATTCSPICAGAPRRYGSSCSSATSARSPRSPWAAPSAPTPCSCCPTAARCRRRRPTSR